MPGTPVVLLMCMSNTIAEHMMEPRTRWLCKEVAIYCYVVVIMVLLPSLFSGEVYSSKRN